LNPAFMRARAGAAFAAAVTLSLAAAAGWDARAQDEGGAATGAPVYETVVTATTPLHGSKIPLDRVPANVQVASGQDVVANRGPDLADYMNAAMSSVHINQVQNNPLQADVGYRGFVASPVQGTPQGLSMYVDGVRFNEPFGDTINWDLLPSGAIASVNLMPGSNPLFGLNTLGGALSLETKNGFSAPGAAAHLLGGSFGRRAVAFELGSSRGAFATFVAGDLFSEDGWRQQSPSNARRLLADATYTSARTRIDLGLLAAETALDGNGPAPVQLLGQDRSAVFTYPDRTENRLVMPTLRAEHAISPELRLSAVGYIRASRIRSVNGDQGSWAACTDPAHPGQLCTRDEDGGGVVITDGQGAPVPVDLVHPYDAADNGTLTVQHGFGGSLQLAWERDLAGRESHLFVGGSVDASRDDFSADSRLARLSSTRGTLPTDVVVPSSRVGVAATTLSLGLFASETLALRRDLFLTVSARYGHSALDLDDQVGDALDGQHGFSRLNPAVGLSYQPGPGFGLFGGYSESARMPTALELSCADPAAPCRLPNSFIADPPLHPVIARTLEAGARGRWRRPAVRFDYDAAFFRTSNADDILFVSAGALTNQGYFANVGATRRWGVEAGLRGQLPLARSAALLSWSAHYTYLEASFREDFTAPSPNHPNAEGGQTAVHAGAQLPGIPRHIAKAGLGFGWANRASLDLDVAGSAGVYLRGDEANLLPRTRGYLIANLRASLRVSEPLTLFVKVANLFDARYATFGALGNAAPVLGPGYDNRRYEGPGAPRGVWIGLDLRE
jgi:iron complex outermembrane receptor protein